MLDDIDELLNRETRLPSVDDKLFVEDKDWWMNACINGYHDPTELYITGYKEAADNLVRDVANRRGSADALLYPIVFNYRHYIELRLKSLLHDGRRLLDIKHKQKAQHKLSKLWPHVRKILEELWPDGDIEQLKAVEVLINQFEEVDPSSTSFRYPKNFEGDNSVHLGMARVNLRNLKDVVGSMSLILEGSAGAISEYQGYKDDALSDSW